MFFFNMTQLFGGYPTNWWGDDDQHAGAHFLCYSASLVLFVSLILFGNALMDSSNQRPLYVLMRNYFGHGSNSDDRNEGLLLSSLFLFGCFSLLTSLSYFLSNVDFRDFMEGNFGEVLFQPNQFLPLTFFLWGAFCLTCFRKLKGSSLPSQNTTSSQ